jgi:hypothetical protein
MAFAGVGLSAQPSACVRQGPEVRPIAMQSAFDFHSECVPELTLRSAAFKTFAWPA